MTKYRVKLLTPDQFGPDGPQRGDEGRVVQEARIDEGDELWLAVEFDTFPEFSFAWVAHWMVEKL